MKKRKTLILMLSLVCLLVVGIGFANLTRQLTIKGSVTANPADFVVEFVADQQNEPEAYTVSTADKNNDTATIKDIALSTVGDTKTVFLTLANKSEHYNAIIDEITVAELEDGSGLVLGTDVTVTITHDGRIDAEGEMSIQVVFKLIKSQVETKTASFTVTFDATAEAISANS